MLKQASNPFCKLSQSLLPRVKSKHPLSCGVLDFAEARGFEPLIRFPRCRVSSAVPSTTQPRLHIFHCVHMEAAKRFRTEWFSRFTRGPKQSSLLWPHLSHASNNRPMLADFEQFCYIKCASYGPIVYRLGHELFKLRSGVRLPVGSHKRVFRFSRTLNPFLHL
jgi:hypothetical protein